jgi:hypothetical protein
MVSALGRRDFLDSSTHARESTGLRRLERLAAMCATTTGPLHRLALRMVALGTPPDRLRRFGSSLTGRMMINIDKCMGASFGDNVSGYVTDRSGSLLGLVVAVAEALGAIRARGIVVLRPQPFQAVCIPATGQERGV